ncbi:hypothetical protein Tco_0859418 [Tanacetum coccineum]|uniref:Uncharacterized protein n=1 Tax=Tanacetum coccineum TaxID=301880 RepID=A0ABQ5BFK9_9ASTR
MFSNWRYLLDTSDKEVETLKNELSQCKQEIYRLDTQKVKLDLENKVRQEQALVIQRNKRNAELVQENDLLKSTLSGKEKSITFLQSEKEKILSEKKDLADSYLDEIVCLKNANKVARDMLQRFNMPTQTIPMLSKKPKNATNDLHKDTLGTRNPGLGYMAKRAQPVLYDADTLLHPTHHPVSIWDSEEVLVHQVVSMKKMNEKPGHVRPANGFYDKLNALKFVPQQELSREQAYWLPANERASQTSNPNSPVTPFVRKSRPPSQVLTSLRNVNAVFPQFEGIIKERTTQKPDYVSEWCFDYAKQFVEQQLCIDTSSASNAIFEINKLRKQLQGKDDTIRNLETQINITRMLNVGSTEGSCDQQALETDRIQLQDMITSLRIQNTKLKAQVTGKTSSGPSKPNEQNPKYLLQEFTTTSTRPTQKPPVQQNKKPNVSVNLSTRTKPATEPRKPMPKSDTRNHRIWPSKSENARRAAIHNRNLNFDHNQFVIRSLKSVNTKTPQAKHNGNHTKKVWKATRKHNVNTTKTAWRPKKVVGSVKPQWRPTGRHFGLFDTCPLTRIVEPIVEPLELTPSVSSSSKVTMISRSQGRTVADSIAERLTRPNAYKVKTDCSIIPVWRMTTQSFRCKTCAHIHTTVSEVIKKAYIQGFRTISENQCLLQILKVTMLKKETSSKLSKIQTDNEHVR